MRIGICDDDMEFSLELQSYVEKYAQKQNIPVDITIFSDSKTMFANMLLMDLFDLLFLDIELGGETGVEIGKKLRAELKYETIQIVFVSSKQEYAMQLFELRPMNFLVKPISAQKVENVMAEYSRLFECQSCYFTYKAGGRDYKVSEQHIIYLQSLNKKVRLVTQDGVEEYYGKLSDVLGKLSENIFCPVHKSYVINMNYVVKYGKDTIQMANGDIIPISRSMRKFVSRRMLDSTGEK